MNTIDMSNAVVEKITSARIRKEPFPYIVIKDFLPASLYTRLLTEWPPDELFRVTNYERRRQLYLNRDLCMFPADTIPLWRDLLELSEVINKSLIHKFRPVFAYKFFPLLGEKWQEIINQNFTTSYKETQLAQYTGVCEMHPHVDSMILPINSFLYCSEHDHVEPELGTVLYRSFGFMIPLNNFELPASLQEKVLRPDKIIPYRRNTLFSFVNTPCAFHGVNKIDIGDRWRRILLFSPILTSSSTTLPMEFSRRPAEIDFGDGDRDDGELRT
jgi:hypothetical protein